MKRILLVKPCCLGDALMATPVLRALRAALPEARIDVLVTPWAAPAFDGHPAIHRLIPYPDRPTLPVLVRLARDLSGEHYDWGLGLDRSPRVALLLFLSRIPVRAGLDAGGRGRLYTHRVQPRPSQHETELYLAVAQALGIAPHGVEPEYVVPPEARRIMAERLDSLPRPLVVMHPGGAVNPGSTLLAKRWPPDRYAELADRLRARFGGTVILVGSRSDRSAVENVLRTVASPVLDWSTRLRWDELAALLSLADLFVGNDSGVGHLAAAVGTATVSIFGPTSPVLYRPLGPRSLVCAPPASWALREARDLRRSVTIPAALDVHNVTIDEVLAACTSLLQPGDAFDGS
ncbi:MAG: lipopolysaccharide heptosyltransferase II [Thermomicrobium sp.]|nr:lipopolysaccharide heptosyltransferase II [Thermomicrobium sp.]MDW7982248.1 lipopolysaccharide heptosyltransferase II [Thermomicrobium sp.]